MGIYNKLVGLISTERNLQSYQAPLDGFRSLSLFFIVFFHVFFLSQYLYKEQSIWIDFFRELPIYLQWMRRGDYAVDIFFVLSAFLIGGFAIKQHDSNGKLINKFHFKTFYVKRFFRIYPIYVVALSISILIDGWNNNVIYNILAVNNIFGISDIVIPWSWTIALELQFYIVCPFIAFWLVSTRNVLLPCLTLILISFTWNAYFIFSNDLMQANSLLDIMLRDIQEEKDYIGKYFYYNTISRFYPFVIGLGASYYWHFYKDKIADCVAHNQIKIKIGVAIVLLLIFIKTLPSPFLSMTEMEGLYKIWYFYDWLIGRLIFSILIVLLMIYSLVIIDSKQNIIGKLLSHPILKQYANISLSGYLFHPPLIALAAFTIGLENNLIELVPVWKLLIVFILTMLYIIVTGKFFYHLLEKHFISHSFKNKIDAYFYQHI